MHYLDLDQRYQVCKFPNIQVFLQQNDQLKNIHKKFLSGIPERIYKEPREFIGVPAYPIKKEGKFLSENVSTVYMKDSFQVTLRRSDKHEGLMAP